MAIGLADTEIFYVVLASDKGKTKTKFGLSPLGQFEYFRLAGVSSKFFSKMKDDAEVEAFVEMFDSEDGEKFGEMIERFLKDHLIEIKNAKGKDGKLTNLEGDQIDIRMINPMNAIELITQSINRVTVAQGEAKN